MYRLHLQTCPVASLNLCFFYFLCSIFCAHKRIIWLCWALSDFSRLVGFSSFQTDWDEVGVNGYCGVLITWLTGGPVCTILTVFQTDFLTHIIHWGYGLNYCFWPCSSYFPGNLGKKTLKKITYWTFKYTLTSDYWSVSVKKRPLRLKL